MVLVTAFFGGVFLFGRALEGRPGNLVQIAAEALIGACASALAALTSCLDRYANGFELMDSGRKVPPPLSKEDEKKQMFNRRMAR